MGLFNPADWFMEFIQGAADTIGSAYANLLTEIVKILLVTSLPSAEVIKSDWFMMRLGGTYGLATKLMGLVAVSIALFAAFTPLRNHGYKLGQALLSVLYVGVFAVAFFPVYSLLVDVSRGLFQGMLNLAQGAENATPDSIVSLISSSALPVNAIGKFITALLAATLGGFAILEAFAMQISLLFLLLFYPVLIALRPLGRWANTVFNGANSALMVILLAGPIMGFGFLLPLLAREMIPFADTGVGAFAFTLLGGIFAIVVPVVLLVIFFQKSSEIFGRVDSTVGGKLDINSMPTVSTKEINQSVDDVHTSGIKTFLGTVGVGALGADLAHSDDLFGDMKNLAVEGTSVAATAMGHPEVSAVLQTVDTTLTKEKRKHSEQAQSLPAEGM